MTELKPTVFVITPLTSTNRTNLKTTLTYIPTFGHSVNASLTMTTF